jgi:ribosomal protein S24E
MKISVISDKENPFLKRKELQINIEHEGSATPSKAELQQALAAEFKKEVEQVDIRDIFSDSGISSSKSRIFLWEEKRVADLSKVVKEEKKPKEEKKEKAGAESGKNEGKKEAK